MTKRRHRGQPRRGGRVTPRKDRREEEDFEFLPARTTSLQLNGPVPTDSDHKLMNEIFDSGWNRYWPDTIMSLLLYGDWDRRSQPSQYMMLLCGRHFAPDDHGQDPDLDRGWVALSDDEEHVQTVTPLLHRFAVAAGVPDPVTCADLVALGEHYGLFTYDEHNRFLTVRPVPPVSASGVLTDEEVAEEQDIAWQRQQEPTVYAIISHFVDGHLDVCKATMTEMALQLDTGVEAVRGALAALDQADDFTVNPDPTTLTSTDVVTIAVDWEIFDRTRVSIQGTEEGWTIPAHMFALVGGPEDLRRALPSLSTFGIEPWMLTDSSKDEHIAVYRTPPEMNLSGLHEWMATGEVMVLWPGHSIAMSPDETQRMNDALDADPDIDDLHRAAIDYANALDRHYLKEHPDLTVYQRAALDHEVCRPDGTACVDSANFTIELTEISPGGTYTKRVY